LFPFVHFIRRLTDMSNHPQPLSVPAALSGEAGGGLT
jgi:hypothetical protein